MTCSRRSGPCRRALLTAAIVLASLTAACHSPDAKLVSLLKDEIRLLGEAAKTPGPRSPDEIARIDSDVAAAVSHVDSVTR